MGGSLVERYRTARRDPARAVLEGFHSLKHAIRFGADIREMAAVDPDAVAALADRLAPDVRAALRARLRVVDAETFAVLSPSRVHTGIIGIAARPAVDVRGAFAASTAAPIVLLENARSPFNVGASVRVAAAAGAAGLFVTGPTDPWAPSALRAGAGLAWALPVGRIDRIPASDRPIVAIDPDGSEDAAIPPRAVLAFGTERDGLSRALRDRAQARLRIPMRDGVSSLNLATAVAAILFRQR